MFGSFRFLLAFFVVLTHLVSISKIGQFAVFGFFVLSGFLISLAVSENYGFGVKNFINFWINRALRLYPSYLIVVVLSSFMLIEVGDVFSRSYNDYFAIPDTLVLWLQNITMVYPSWNPKEISTRVVPPSWALMVELFYYLLISLGVFKHVKLTNFIILGALSFHLYGVLFLTYDDIYFGILPALLPFSIGAQVFNYRSRYRGLYEYLNSNFNYIFSSFILSIVAFLPTFYYLKYIQKDFPVAEIVLKLELYLSLLLVTALVAALSVATKSPFGFSKKMEALFGEWAYPMYLYHMVVGMGVSYLLWDAPLRGLNYAGIISFLVACPLILVLCHVNFIMESPVRQLRKRFRKVHK